MILNLDFILNGKKINITTNDKNTLLWILRTHFGLTGTKYGCGAGLCGSCTVLINKHAVRSCQVAMKNVSSKEVITIEGLAKNGILHPLQKAFIQHDALQCGYCTPGMILNAAGLLYKNPNPTRPQIIDDMEDNLCRCGSYQRIIDAVITAAEIMRGQ